MLVTPFLQLAHAFEPGVPYKLSAELTSNGNVFSDFQFTPDGTHVIYRANGNNGEIDLFQASISSGDVINLTEDASSSGSGDVLSFKISNDGQKIVYWLINSGEQSLWAKLPGLTLRISGTLAATLPTLILDFTISDDSSRVVYRAQTSMPFVASRLFVKRIEQPSAAQPNRIGRELVPGGGIRLYQFVPNSNTVVYYGDVRTAGVLEIFFTPADFLSSTIVLNPPLAAMRDVRSDFSISPDGQYVVYRADARIDEVTELYRSTLTSPVQAIKLNPNNLAASEEVGDFKISPDSKRVVYRSDERIDDVAELFSVPINNAGGDLAVRISDSLIADGDVIEYKISPNSARVTYLADQEVDEKIELFSGLISGLSVSSLTPNLADNDDVVSYEFNQSGSRVVYLARVSNSQQLRSVRIFGGDDLPLNPPLAINANVLKDYRTSPSSDRVFYRADQINSTVFELFSTEIEGPITSNVRLNTGFLTLSEQDVFGFQISPDGKFLVYRADQDRDQQFELFAVNLEDNGDFEENDTVCVPIKARNGNLAVICL